MSEQLAGQGLTNEVLTQVHEGMKVYDHDGKHIGKVDEVYLGGVSGGVDERGGYAGPATGSAPMHETPALIVGASVPEINTSDNIPDQLRNRMYREGFIRIDEAGLFAGHRYAVRDQVESVEGDKVHLRVPHDQLIKP